MKNRFTMSRTDEMGVQWFVFEVNKEIPDKGPRAAWCTKDAPPAPSLLGIPRKCEIRCGVEARREMAQQKLFRRQLHADSNRIQTPGRRCSDRPRHIPRRPRLLFRNIPCRPVRGSWSAYTVRSGESFSFHKGCRARAALSMGPANGQAHASD